MAGIRPVIPPDFVKGSTRLLLACRDHPVIFYTYCILEALAWGAESRVIKFDGDWFNQNFGIPQGTLLRHLVLLSKQPIRAILVYRSAGAGYNRRFEITLMNPEQEAASLIFESCLKNENPSLSLNIIKDSPDSLKEQNNCLKNETVSKMSFQTSDQYPETWIREAWDIAKQRGKPRNEYVEGILNNWRREGHPSGGNHANYERKSHTKNGQGNGDQALVISPDDEAAALAVLARQGG
jgi:DnaD/phage-associated family protein